jgi:hypothetical protein
MFIVFVSDIPYSCKKHQISKKHHLQYLKTSLKIVRKIIYNIKTSLKNVKIS